MPTRTQEFLEALAGQREIPYSCCMTNTQKLIADAAERVNALDDEIQDIKSNPDVVDIVPTYQDLQAYDTSTLTDKDIIRVLSDSTHGGQSSYYRYNATTGQWTYVGTDGGAGSVILTSVADTANRRRNWSFKDSNETFSYQNLLTHLENGEMPVIYIEELGIYQNVDYWGEKTLMDDSKVIDLLIEECYGVETLVNWHELTPVQEALSQQAPRELHVVVWEDGHVSIDRMSFLTQTLELEVSGSDYYFNLSGTTVLNEEAGYIDFYDDQALAGGVLVELINMAMALKVTNDDDGTKMANRANSSGVVQVEKNGNRIKRAIVTWEGVNSIAYDPNTGDPILTRYRGVFSVDSDDGAFTLKTTPIQDIPNGENMGF